MAAKEVIYWEKVPEFIKIFKTDQFGRTVIDERGTRFNLSPCKAIVKGDSDPVCGLCREPEASHNRSRRRHPFTHPIGGLTLDVTHVNGIAAQYKNVQQKKEANCYTEEK